MSRPSLDDLVRPEHTAVVTMELQRGVVGDEAVLPMLRDRVQEVGLLDAAGRLCSGARAAGVGVVHCTAVNRPDGAAATANSPIFAMNARQRRETGSTPIDAGSPGAEIVPELGVAESDIEVARIHGMTPFTSTSLDQILRNLGVTTVVVTGVSVNLGVIGLCLSAVDLGYQVVVARDAVCGVPADYEQAVVDNSLRMLATISSVDDLLAAWP